MSSSPSQFPDTAGGGGSPTHAPPIVPGAPWAPDGGLLYSSSPAYSSLGSIHPAEGDRSEDDQARGDGADADDSGRTATSVAKRQRKEGESRSPHAGAVAAEQDESNVAVVSPGQEPSTVIPSTASITTSSPGPPAGLSVGLRLPPHDQRVVQPLLLPFSYSSPLPSCPAPSPHHPDPTGSGSEAPKDLELFNCV